MAAYYNEKNRYCAAYLRNLMAEGLIPDGDVDERSIEDVRPDDLRGYVQHHFFAGLGGWPLALRIAGWPADRPVWTGSAPCQPFSAAGKGAGFADERHLWPCLYHLISQCRPPKFYGEQVAAASDWIRLVRSDLEALGYAMGAIPIEAASAGADHFRDRYWFVANRNDAQRRPNDTSRHNDVGAATGRNESTSDAAERGDRVVVNDPGLGWGQGWTEHEFRSRGFTASVASIDGCQYIECPDGKWRRLPPPRVRWLGNGIPARVDKLRAIGNAIDPRPAAAFIRATS
jgi:DNA (cytosine-5)-methyltransferase 1